MSQLICSGVQSWVSWSTHALMSSNWRAQLILQGKYLYCFCDNPLSHCTALRLPPVVFWIFMCKISSLSLLSGDGRTGSSIPDVESCGPPSSLHNLAINSVKVRPFIIVQLKYMFTIFPHFIAGSCWLILLYLETVMWLSGDHIHGYTSNVADHADWLIDPSCGSSVLQLEHLLDLM